MKLEGIHSVDKILERALKNHKMLRTLKIKDCKLSKSALESLIEDLEDKILISKIDLSYNDFPPTAGIQIGNLIRRHNNSLNELNLSYNRLLDEGHRDLFEAIATSGSVLKSLDVS